MTNTKRKTGVRRLRPRGFVARTLDSLNAGLDRALFAEELASRRGLLQGITPPVKTAALLLLLVDAALSRDLLGLATAFGIGLMLALASRIPLSRLAKGPWLGALIFTGAIALPAIFITPGRAVWRLPLFGWPVTEQGLRASIILIARVETAVTFSALLVLTTPWALVLKAMSVLGMPSVVTTILGMTHRYIFLFIHTAQDMFEARQSRSVGRLSGAAQRRLAAAGAGVLLGKTHQLSGEVYLAMCSRGFRGEVHSLTEFRVRWRDVAAIAVAAILLTIVYVAGHSELTSLLWSR
jgi:cobalt/nickel transport system permease protein